VLLPSGGVEVVAEGLQSPWSILRLPTGGVLVSERDTANVVEVQGDGSLRVAATVPGVVPGGEGGLLGLAFRASDGELPEYVYAYFTAASDNRIVRMPLTGGPGSLGLGAPEDVLTGIPKAGNHDGGRIAFGPDGFLYATAGDAGNQDAAQDPASLSGKILRMTADGRPAPGNPFDNFTWSFGHRNPQGLAWDAAGDLWAAEFGQNTWDELNRITRGANYGWPIVEGQAGDPRFVDPVAQWSTAEASPSGLAIVGDTLFLAALRGERLWSIAPATTGGPLTVTPWFVGELGRLRDVTAGPDGELWFISNNTDGRGSPSAGDDRLYRVRLAPA
jgi:glucose/arabinose dehydrogenase